MESKNEKTIELEEIAAKLTVGFFENRKTFMLGEPTMLTVKKSSGGFSKKPHIGGEDFIPVSAYAGKRNNIILVFQPADVADYQHVEMSEEDANKLFSGFSAYMTSTFAGLKSATKDIAEAISVENELAKNMDRFEQYADLGFGSF